MMSSSNEVLAEGKPRKGWLVNMLPSSRVLEIDSISTERACLDLYFLNESGVGRFTTYVVYEPYFYVLCRPGTVKVVKTALERKFEHHLSRSEVIRLENLEAPNHLSFNRNINRETGIIKLSFRTVLESQQARKALLPIVKKNQTSSKVVEAYSSSNSTSKNLSLLKISSLRS